MSYRICDLLDAEKERRAGWRGKGTSGTVDLLPQIRSLNLDLPLVCLDNAATWLVCDILQSGSAGWCG